jgi:hypothetical protein
MSFNKTKASLGILSRKVFNAGNLKQTFEGVGSKGERNCC